MTRKEKKSAPGKPIDIALFDLDHTLLAGDSDFAWGCFLEKVGAVDEHHKEQNARYYELYRQQKLDINAYIRFALKPLSRHPKKRLLAWRKEFIETVIRPMIGQPARHLLMTHKAQGHTTVIITSTNNFVVEPIAELFGVHHLIATEAEEKEGVFTGAVHGIPCFREGKVTRFLQWLETLDGSCGRSWFYSDSINDLPLLEQVDHAVVVNGDAELLHHAHNKNWPCLSLLT